MKQPRRIEISLKDGAPEKRPTLKGGIEWVATLRDPEWANRQGTQFLRMETGDGFKYCCLGVLCHIQKQESQFVSGIGTNATGLSSINECYMALDSLGDIPDCWKVTGYDEEGYYLIYGSLAKLNDKGFTFMQIAAVIETCWNCQPNTTTNETN